MELAWYDLMTNSHEILKLDTRIRTKTELACPFKRHTRMKYKKGNSHDTCENQYSHEHLSNQYSHKTNKGNSQKQKAYSHELFNQNSHGP